MIWILLLILCWPWVLQARDAWRNRRIVRRECAFIDFEWELYRD